MESIITDQTIKDFLKILRENPTLREQFIEVLEPAKYIQRDELAVLLQELKSQREETAKNFQQVFERFEHSDKRFEAMDKRFEAMDKRFEDLLASMNQRFEAVDKRFEAVDKRFEAVDKRFAEQIKELRTISAGLGSLGNRTGNEFESLLRSLFSEFLETQNIDAQKIEKFGLRNKNPEILHGLSKITFDGYIHDGRKILLEIKFTMDENKVHWFYERCKAFEKIQGFLPEMWVIAVTIDQQAIEFAKDNNMKVITREGFI